LVKQSLVRTNIFGEPMTPCYKDITVTLVLASGTRTEACSTHEMTAAPEHEIIPSMAGRFLYVYKRLVDSYIVGTPINAARPYSAFNVRLNRRDPGPDGVVNTGDDGPMVTIYVATVVR
jgi:hypothetical protein